MGYSSTIWQIGGYYVVSDEMTRINRWWPGNHGRVVVASKARGIIEGEAWGKIEIAHKIFSFYIAFSSQSMPVYFGAQKNRHCVTVNTDDEGILFSVRHYSYMLTRPLGDEMKAMENRQASASGKISIW